MSRPPVVYVAHGAPLLAVDAAKGAPLKAWGERLHDVKAVLWISAHFEEAPIALSAPDGAPLVYDFYGFPKPLYELIYPSPGAPALAERITGLLASRPVEVQASRGLDHGAWVPALHLFPEVNVPMIQLSLPSRDPSELLALGRQLAPLREEGVLIAGSGNITHNLGRLKFDDAAPPESWARDFDAWAERALSTLDVDTLLDWEHKGPGARIAHPTSEHLNPLFVALGAALESGIEEVRYPVEGWEYGNITRRSVELS